MSEAKKPKMRITGFNTTPGQKKLRRMNPIDAIGTDTSMNAHAGSPGTDLLVPGLHP